MKKGMKMDVLRSGYKQGMEKVPENKQVHGRCSLWENRSKQRLHTDPHLQRRPNHRVSEQVAVEHTDGGVWKKGGK